MIWESINTMLDSEMKDKVRTGEAFELHCPECWNVCNVNYVFLYRQMEEYILELAFMSGERVVASSEIMSGFYFAN